MEAGSRRKGERVEREKMGRNRGEAEMRQTLDILLPKQALSGAVVTACPPHLKQQHQRRAEQSLLRPSSPIRMAPPPSAAPSGNGGSYDARLRALEIQVGRIDERVASVQKDIGENLAKKNDITGLKVWILGGVLSAIGIGAGAATIIVKAFF